jgi:TfoX/Sxy family transcriptional regulator of competence genes
MQWKKAPEELKEYLDAAMSGLAGQRRLMFGYPAYFINGNMFIGLFQDTVFIRLPMIVMKQLLTDGEAKPFEPLPGRVMKDYIVLPRNVYSDGKRFMKLVNQTIEHTAALPPKIKKKKQRA